MGLCQNKRLSIWVNANPRVKKKPKSTAPLHLRFHKKYIPRVKGKNTNWYRIPTEKEKARAAMIIALVCSCWKYFKTYT